MKIKFMEDLLEISNRIKNGESCSDLVREKCGKNITLSEIEKISKLVADYYG